jgi:hypothetical protein
MNNNRMTIRFVMIAILLSALTACGAPSAAPPAPTALPVSPQQLPTVTTVPATQPPAAPTKASAVPPTAQSEKPTAAAPVAPVATAPLTDGGVNLNLPRLIFSTANGLMSVTADGTSKHLFTHAQPVLDRNLNDALAPAGGWMAFTSGDNPMAPDRKGSGPLTLNLLNVVDGTIKPITPLFSVEMEQAITAATTTGDRTDAIEAGIAILQNSDTLKWSPDGRYLAFIAAIDGPSSDVYSYDRETGQINRLTDGPNQAARLFWSPDSQWIVHEEVESFGTGAGWNVKAVWAAAPDGNNTRKLYDTTSSGDEVFVDWIAPDQFLVYSWTPVGWRNVRIVDLNTGEAQSIGPKFEVQTLAYDPKTQTQLYYVDDFTAQQNGSSGGLYLATAGQAKLIASGDWYDTRWLPHVQLFFAKGRDGVISVTPDGVVKKYADEEALPIDAPDGAWLLAWGDGNYTSPIGLRLYTPDGELKRTITSDSVMFATWSPDSAGVFYQSNGQLYFVAIPNGEPQLIGETTARELNSLGWVKP